VTIVLSGRDFVSNSHRPDVALYFVSSTNTCVSLYLNFEHPILREPSVSSRYTPKAESRNTLPFNTGEESSFSKKRH
jgi:hypothetical protein